MHEVHDSDCGQCGRCERQLRGSGHVDGF
jgi:hypothetical protein